MTYKLFTETHITRLFEICAVLVTMNATRAATIVRGTPFAWAFEMLWLAHFLTIPVLVAIYSIFLVIIPVWDTSKAAKVD